MSDSNKPPKPPPPDDFTKTTPNINLPDDADESSGGEAPAWDKTNYRLPAQPPAEDWGNTVNFNTEEEDFSTSSSSRNDPKVPDWGITRADINLDEEDFGGGGHDAEDFGKTTPYFQLPQAEREKYQNLAKSPAKAEQEQETEEESGGIPGWVWVSGALFSMFFFALIALGLIYYFFIYSPTFDLVITDVPAGSQVFENNSPWGETTSESGTVRLRNLRAGQTKRITFNNPNWNCESETIVGKPGEPYNMRANCTRSGNTMISSDCLNIKAGDYEKSRECAYTELKKLDDPPDVDQLLRAMNLYINHFDTNQHTIRPVDRKFLETAAGYMKKIPEDVIIEVGGHTDSVGSDQSNLELSKRRANEVRNALIALGIRPDRLTMKAYGEKSPKTTNETDDGKFQNRRIEYKRAN